MYNKHNSKQKKANLKGVIHITSNEVRTNRYIPIFQGIAVFTWTIIVKLITMIVIYALSYSDDSFLHQCPDWLLHTVVLSAGLLIYNSALRVMILYHRDSRIEYLESRNPEFAFSCEISDILRSGDFILRSVTISILFAISALIGAFPEIGGLILRKDLFRSAEANIISAAIVPPVLILIGLFTTYEVRRYWIALDKNKDTEKIEGSAKMILNVILISLAYPIIFPMAPILLFTVASVFNILVSLFGALNIIGSIVFFILLFTAIYLIPLLNGLHKRRKFIKKLKAICRDSGWELSAIKNPYASFFRSGIGSNFTITRGADEYKCAFVSTLHKRTPLIFTTNTDACFRHRIGTKDHHYTINHSIEYGIRGDGKKCIILSPLPKKLFVESDGGSREILPGDRIWDYTVYNMSGFINAIDRNCLDKYAKRQ